MEVKGTLKQTKKKREVKGTLEYAKKKRASWWHVLIGTRNHAQCKPTVNWQFVVWNAGISSLKGNTALLRLLRGIIQPRYWWCSQDRQFYWQGNKFQTIPSNQWFVTCTSRFYQNTSIHRFCWLFHPSSCCPGEHLCDVVLHPELLVEPPGRQWAPCVSWARLRGGLLEPLGKAKQEMSKNKCLSIYADIIKYL